MKGKLLTVMSCLFISLLVFVNPSRTAYSSPTYEKNTCADLVATVSLSVNQPEVDQLFAIQVVVTNRGDAESNAFRTYLYVDPVQPPTLTTTDTTSFGTFGLTANEQLTFEYDYTFSITGTHTIYVWVDRDNQVSGECNESNNLTLRSVPIGIDPGCKLDDYEGATGDNSCASAPIINTDGTAQRHNLCAPGDEDWVRFNGVAGVEYTIVAGNVEEDADIELNLLNRCDAVPLRQQDPILGRGARLQRSITKSGQYYVQVKHHESTYGVHSGYDLSINANCSIDAYEPDSQCNLAHQILPNDPLQRHSFCGEGDADWLTLQATAGVNYQISTQDWENSSQPVIALYDSCEGTALQQMSARAGLNWVAPESGLYRLRVTNSNPNIQGLNTGYGISLTVLSSSGDSYEPDDAPNQAKSLSLGETGQTHLIADPGDQDWLAVDLTANQSYRLETSNLSVATDTYLCLYAPDGTSLLGCDDDSGAGLASKLWWRATSSGRYLFKVRHFQPEAGGDHASYQLRAIAADQECAPDSFEPDSLYSQAREVIIGAAAQTHTICDNQRNTSSQNTVPENAGLDSDWVRFFVDSAGVYELRASSEGEDADPIITLYDIDGETILFANDDYTTGLSARLLWRFTRPGIYFARVSAFNPQTNGEGTEYRLQISKSQEVPTPLPTTPPPPTPTFTPTATPSPTATPTTLPEAPPTPTGPIKTLIVAYPKRMSQFYTLEQAQSLTAKLQQLAQYQRAPGILVDLDEYFSATQAYAAWDGDPGNNAKANAVADAIRAVIWDKINSYPQIDFLVLIGDDRILPHRREQTHIKVLDENQLEQKYAIGELSPNSTIGQALRQGVVLFDDFYASRQPLSVQSSAFYLPEKALGRLVETPGEIIQSIDRFLLDKVLSHESALVISNNINRNRLSDAQKVCEQLRLYLSDSTLCHTAADPWDEDTLRVWHFTANPAPDIQMLGIHAKHWALQAGNGNFLDSATLSSSTTLADTIVVAIGSHSALAVEPNELHPLDWPQFYTQQGAIFIGNSATELFLTDNVPGLSRKLFAGLANQLLQSPTVGEAVMRAKQQYWQESNHSSLSDRHVLQQTMLYNLPMYRLSLPLDAPNEFPSVKVNAGTLSAAGQTTGNSGIVTGTLAVEIDDSYSSLPFSTTVDGGFYTLDGHANWEPNTAGQPIYFLDLDTTRLGEFGNARGLLWLGGVYTDVLHSDLLIPQLAFETDVNSSKVITKVLPRTSGNIDTSTASSAIDPFPAQLDPNGKRLSVDMGQYNLLSGTQRLYRQMKFEFTYSDSVDTLAPTVAHSSARVAATGFSVKIEASDASGIRRVLVLYTDRQGQWNQLDLTYQPDSQKWVGSIPGTNDIDWFAQVVDGAGNVTRVLNKTGTFRAVYMADSTALPPAVYLPIVAR